MAELLVRNVDKVNPTSEELNRMCLKRGDVVCVREDGWPWSPKELAGDPWTVIKFIGAAVEEAQPYMLPEEVDGATVRPRMSYFDLDAALPQTFFIGGGVQMLSYRVVKT